MAGRRGHDGLLPTGVSGVEINAPVKLQVVWPIQILLHIRVLYTYDSLSIPKLQILQIFFSQKPYLKKIESDYLQL